MCAYVKPEEKQEEFVQVKLEEAPKTPLPVTPTKNGMVLDQGRFFSPNWAKGRRGWSIDSDGNAEFQSGTFRGTFILGGTLITINNIDDLQNAIDELDAAGNGGTVSLVPGTYSATSSFTIPSGITLEGNGATIDFGGGAYQILIQGTNAYSTGTITLAAGSTSVVGSGTTWTAAMIGRSILLGDFWYEITAVADNTHLTIGEINLGVALSGDTYVIATTVDDVRIQNITLQNSSTSVLKFRYVNSLDVDGVNLLSSGQGIDGQDSANFNFTGASAVDSCTVGIVLNNVPFCTVFSLGVTNITGGNGIDFTRVTNTAISAVSIQAITGVGFKFTNCSDLGFGSWVIIACSSHGIEMASGNSDLDFFDGQVNTCGGDGIKLTATSDYIIMSIISLFNNTGYGVNIAASSCDDNIISGNNYRNNASGAIQDLGTGTNIS